MGHAAAALDGRAAGTYARHRPETTTLYAVVRDNVETLYAAVAAGFDGAALPPFVRRELEGYTEPQSVQRFLRHRGEPTEPPARAPPRDPQYFKTLVRRRPASETSQQGELFEEH